MVTECVRHAQYLEDDVTLDFKEAGRKNVNFTDMAKGTVKRKFL
jgi:hypothetical protein